MRSSSVRNAGAAAASAAVFVAMSAGLYAPGMADGDSPALWPARLRWRLKGATLWPLFWLLTVIDAVLLKVLPIEGADGPPLFGALLLALLFNLLAVAVLGRAGAWWLRRHRPALPRVVAEDRAGSAMLLGVTG